jgi:hypothetical protein
LDGWRRKTLTTKEAKLHKDLSRAVVVSIPDEKRFYMEDSDAASTVVDIFDQRATARKKDERRKRRAEATAPPKIRSPG